MDYTTMLPSEVRAKIRSGEMSGQTSGMCQGYAQANLVALPREIAYDFLLFAQRNPRACPLLEVSDTGSRQLHEIADNADIATDIPRYRIYEKGILTREVEDASPYWRDDLVSFLIGCSFSFEGDLLAADVPSESPVAFYLEKSVDAVSAMFGAVYAGGFSSFIDVRQPAARAQKALDVLDPAVLITDEENAE